MPRKTALVLSLAAVLAAVAGLIGEHEITLGPGKVVLFPIIWAIVLGAAVSLQPFKPLSPTAQRTAVSFVEAGIIVFIVDLAIKVGQEFSSPTELSWALLFQEFGHVFGTVILALPVAVAVKMGRASVGATYSIDREPNLAFTAEKYGADSPEYHGSLGMYIFGSVFGALYLSLIAGYIASAGWMDPRALALGSGVGSGSVMVATSAAIAEMFPAQEEEILAYAASANLITEVAGVYISCFVALPLAERLYRFWCRILRRPEEQATAPELVAARTQATTVDSESRTSSAEPESHGGPETFTTPRLLGTLAGVVVLMLITNTLITGALSVETVIGIVLLAVITFLAFLLKRYVRMLPALVFAATVGILIASPVSPVADIVDTLTAGIDFIAIATPVLVLVGLSIGKDRAVIKRLGWRVIVVALVSFAATFFTAAAIGQLFL